MQSPICVRTSPSIQGDCLSTRYVPGIIVGSGCHGSNPVRSRQHQAHVLPGVDKKQESIESYLHHFDTAGALRKIEKCLPRVEGRFFPLVGHQERLFWVALEVWSHQEGQEFPEGAQTEWVTKACCASEAGGKTRACGSSKRGQSWSFRERDRPPWGL